MSQLAPKGFAHRSVFAPDRSDFLRSGGLNISVQSSIDTIKHLSVFDAIKKHCYHCNDSQTRILDVQQYTCNDYRQEMILLSLRRRLNDPEIDDHEKQKVEEAIRQLEKEMGIS